MEIRAIPLMIAMVQNYMKARDAQHAKMFYRLLLIEIGQVYLFNNNNSTTQRSNCLMYVR